MSDEILTKEEAISFLGLDAKILVALEIPCQSDFLLVNY